MKLTERYPLFLVLLPAFILVHIQKDYGQLLDYWSCMKEILILCLVPWVVYGVAWLCYRSVSRANLFSLIVLFLFYFLGDIKDALKSAFPYTFWQSYTLIMPLALIIIIASFFLIKRSSGTFAKFFRFIHLALLLFIALDVVAMIWHSGRLEKHQEQTLADFKPCTDCPRPDIYYFLLDEYTSTPELKKNLSYDNTDIERYLQEKGFQVLHGSRSNYTLTAFSLGSSFSLNYLTSIDTSKNFYLRNYLPGIQIMYDSPLFSMLEKQGYRVFNHSIFNVKGHPSTVSARDHWRTRQLYQQYNIIRKMDNEMGWNFPNWVRFRFTPEKSFMENLDRYDSVGLQQLYRTVHEKAGQPKFVYSHIMYAHFPSIRDSAGRKLRPDDPLPLTNPKEKYRQQITFTNKVLKQMVDSVLRWNATPPVIIVQGDHGFRRSIPYYDSTQFPIMNAWYIPGNKPVLNDSMTSVNTFRFVFDHFFKQQYPMLEDHFYFLKHFPQ